MTTKECLVVAVVSYINKKLTSEELLCKVGDIIQDAQDLSKNQKADILHSLHKNVGSTIVTDMLRYIL